MTRITLFRDEEGKLTGFSCKGHAGYAEAGSDIVCAAVSALSITCCNSLEHIAGVTPDVNEKDGFLFVQVPSGQQNHDVQVILQVFEQGIHDIAASYPKHIVFTTR
ncbi:MAG: ribosomal-processing cysteine protease Prp [Clostridia bacterium]|nr:ribosomal-processing cysteine protease Prp [Clostridia bacterium]